MGRNVIKCMTVWAVVVLLMVGSGCVMNRLSGMGSPVVPHELDNRAPQDVLALAEKSMATASNEQLDYYSPINWSMAEKHLKKAQNLMIKGRDTLGVISEADLSRQLIAKGLVNKQTVLRQLEDVFEMKDRLDKLKAGVHARDDFEDQLSHIAQLIKYIEKNDQDALEKKKKDYLDEMIALEIAVVKKKTLSESLDYLAKARKIDAKKIAPKSWKTAEDTLNQSTIFIESFPRDEKGVARVGLESLRACQHVYYVTKEVAAIKDMNKDDYENLVLDFETMLNRITLGMNHEDVRYMSLHDQSVALSQATEALRRELASCSREILPVATAETILPAPIETLKDDPQPLNTTPQATNDGDESLSQDIAAPSPVDEEKEALPMVDIVPQRSDEGNVTRDEPENNDPLTLNPDDLYLSDEDRELRNKRLSATTQVSKADMPPKEDTGLVTASDEKDALAASIQTNEITSPKPDVVESSSEPKDIAPSVSPDSGIDVTPDGNLRSGT